MRKNGEIQVALKQIDTYMDYEIYTYEIINNSEKTILLANNQNINDIYLKDDNGIKYPYYSNTVLEDNLLVKSQETKTIEIKYYNKYSSEKDIESSVFSKIIMDYEGYINSPNKENYNNYISIEISV